MLRSKLLGFLPDLVTATLVVLWFASAHLNPGSAGESASADASSASPELLRPALVLGEASPPADSPAAFSVIPESRFGPGEIQSAAGLTALAPNLALFQSGNERVPRFSVRGLRENNFMAGEPVVTLYVDDVPYDTLFSRGLPLMDVDSAQLWRGPQGTLFGASRPGGVLNVHTHIPEDLWRGYGTLAYGNYDALNAEAGLSGPLLSNSLFAGVNGLFSRRDGYVFNTVTERHSDTREALAGRAALRWAPVEALDLRFTVSGYRFDDGMLPGSLLGQDLFAVSRNLDGYDRQNSHTESLRASYTGNCFGLLSVTAHTAWRESVLQDADLSPQDLVRTDIGRDGGTWSQEFRVESLDRGAPWRWRAGAFFSDSELDSDSAQLYMFGPSPLTQRTIGRERADNYALFGESTFAFGNFELTGGLRLDYNTRETSADNEDQLAAQQGGRLNTSSHGDRVFRSVQPRIALAYRLEEQTRFWASVTRGFQPGGFRLAISPSLPEFKRADSLHYEVGTRWAAKDESLALSAAAFYNDFHDYQVLRPTSFGSFTMVNAARAHTLGLEIEASAQPFSQLEFTFGAGLTQAKFDRFTDPETGDNLGGRNINFIPEYTLDASVTWRPIAGWFARVGAQMIGAFWLDEANIHDQGAYSLLQARVGYQAKHWGVAVFGRNLLDERYIANAIQFRQPATGDLFIVIPGDPRLFGFELSAAF